MNPPPGFPAGFPPPMGMPPPGSPHSRALRGRLPAHPHAPVSGCCARRLSHGPAAARLQPLPAQAWLSSHDAQRPAQAPAWACDRGASVQARCRSQSLCCSLSALCIHRLSCVPCCRRCAADQEHQRLCGQDRCHGGRHSHACAAGGLRPHQELEAHDGVLLGCALLRSCGGRMLRASGSCMLHACSSRLRNALPVCQIEHWKRAGPREGRSQGLWLCGVRGG